MDTTRLQRQTEDQWWIAPHGKMRVPAVIFATESLICDMDEKVYEQVTNVATLPGIVRASYAMPDAHWGYGFPIGGVAAFDPDNGGVISAGLERPAGSRTSASARWCSSPAEFRASVTGTKASTSSSSCSTARPSSSKMTARR